MICAALRVEEERETLDVEEDDSGVIHFPHVKATAGSSGFLHGSCSVWLIGGPQFDAIDKAGAL